jgi:uncharacterized membrane protein YfcA
MPEALAGALTLPGLPLVVAAALAAGLVYGFAGFGGALVFMPVAARVLGPQLAVAALALMALSSWFTILPAAWRACDRRAAVAMILTALPAIGLGVVILGLGDPVALRWAILALGEVTLLYFDTGGDNVIAKLPGTRAELRGQQVTLDADPAELHLFADGKSLRPG